MSATLAHTKSVHAASLDTVHANRSFHGFRIGKYDAQFGIHPTIRQLLPMAVMRGAGAHLGPIHKTHLKRTNPEVYHTQYSGEKRALRNDGGIRYPEWGEEKKANTDNDKFEISPATIEAELPPSMNDDVVKFLLQDHKFVVDYNGTAAVEGLGADKLTDIFGDKTLTLSKSELRKMADSGYIHTTLDPDFVRRLLEHTSATGNGPTFDRFYPHLTELPMQKLNDPVINDLLNAYSGYAEFTLAEVASRLVHTGEFQSLTGDDNCVTPRHPQQQNMTMISAVGVDLNQDSNQRQKYLRDGNRGKEALKTVMMAQQHLILEANRRNKITHVMHLPIGQGVFAPEDPEDRESVARLHWECLFDLLSTHKVALTG